MTAPADPKRTVNDHGVLGAPRFVPDLPPRSQTSARADSIAELLPALRARPNTWAAISESTSRHVPATCCDYFKADRFGPSTNWETSVRKHPETGVFIGYVKYVKP